MSRDYRKILIPIYFKNAMPLQYSRKDVELIHRFSCIYEGLAFSALSPITIPGGKNPLNDETNARVKERIDLAGEDIKKHLEFHKNLTGSFDRIDRVVLANRRTEFLEAARIIASDTLGYGHLVKTHQDIYGEDAFLRYPFCRLGGRLVHEDYGIDQERIFNPGEDFEGIETETKKLAYLIVKCMVVRRDLPRITTSGGSGGLEVSLRKRLNMVERLLERADPVKFERDANQ